MREFLTSFDKFPSEMVIFAVILLIIEIIRKIYNLSESIKSGKLKKYIEYASLQGISYESKKHIMDCTENYIFKDTTGINAEKRLREEIVLIYNLANGFLSYANFRRGLSYIKIKKGKLYVNIGILDWFFALNDILISLYILAFGTLVLIYAYSLLSSSIIQAILISIISFGIYIVGAYHFYKVFSLLDVYKVKVFLDNPELKYYDKNEVSKSDWFKKSAFVF